MIMIKVINLSEQPRWRTSILNINQALPYFPSTSRDNDDDDDDDQSDYKSDKKEEEPEMNTNQVLSFLKIQKQFYRCTETI